MKKIKSRKVIVKILRNPINIIIIALVIWALVVGLSTSFVFSRIKREAINTINDIMQQVNRAKAVAQDVNVYNKLKVSNVKLSTSASKNEEIVSGLITNNSSKTAILIKLKFAFYNGKDDVLDCFEKENAVRYVEPNKSSEFIFTRMLGTKSESEKTAETKKAASVKVTISDFQVLDK